MSSQALAESEDKVSPFSLTLLHFISVSDFNLKPSSFLPISQGYSLCLSKCIYAGTRPPPQGSSIERLEVTPPRSEIIKDCKEKCVLKTGYVPPKKEKVKKAE